MRFSDGIQFFELEAAGSSLGGHEPIPAYEFARCMRRAAPHELERLSAYLDGLGGRFSVASRPVEETLERAVELLELGYLSVGCQPPSGSNYGEVPDEDDVQPLSALAPEEAEEIATGAVVDAPTMLEPVDAVTPPPAMEPESEIAPPPMPDFECEIEEPEIPSFDFEVSAPS